MATDPAVAVGPGWDPNSAFAGVARLAASSSAKVERVPGGAGCLLGPELNFGFIIQRGSSGSGMLTAQDPVKLTISSTENQGNVTNRVRS
jgi:hypothetical protein